MFFFRANGSGGIVRKHRIVILHVLMQLAIVRLSR